MVGRETFSTSIHGFPATRSFVTATDFSGPFVTLNLRDANEKA